MKREIAILDHTHVGEGCIKFGVAQSHVYISATRRSMVRGSLLNISHRDIATVIEFPTEQQMYKDVCEDFVDSKDGVYVSARSLNVPFDSGTVPRSATHETLGPVKLIKDCKDDQSKSYCVPCETYVSKMRTGSSKCSIKLEISQMVPPQCKILDPCTMAFLPVPKLVDWTTLHLLLPRPKFHIV